VTPASADVLSGLAKRAERAELLAPRAAAAEAPLRFAAGLYRAQRELARALAEESIGADLEEEAGLLLARAEPLLRHAQSGPSRLAEDARLRPLSLTVAAKAQEPASSSEERIKSLEDRLNKLEGAPANVMEALAEILLAKLFRRPVPPESNDRYRRYLNRRDVRRSLDLVRQIRGRKRVEGPRGIRYDLNQIFEDLNFRYFHGLMARPILGWSPYASRTLLGHYDPSHNAIVLSRILDRIDTPRLAVEYVLFHEMLHLRFPAEHRGARRRVHTREFKVAESQFEGFVEAKRLLRSL